MWALLELEQGEADKCFPPAPGRSIEEDPQRLQCINEANAAKDADVLSEEERVLSSLQQGSVANGCSHFNRAKKILNIQKNI